DDLRMGAKSTAILFGNWDRTMVGVAQLCVLAVLAWIGVHLNLGAVYFAGLVGASGFGLYQQYLIRDREREGCFRAFLNNNWLGGAVFLGIFFAYWIER
ncbi:MAG: 4-hydroxybenzoate octaprenyltransferase, partial [Gammaproteobacteria bacterium]|nr:4-hydroxybenzoate octaprenyltransferase [Gammaproteobacteria bacterium]